MLEILAGFISGIVSGTGTGGGTILILCLSLFFGMNQKIAQATNLIFFIPTSIAAIWMNIKAKKVDLKISKAIILYGIIGAIIGAFIAQRVDITLLKKLFGIFLILIALHEIYVMVKTYRNQKNKNNK